MKSQDRRLAFLNNDADMDERECPAFEPSRDGSARVDIAALDRSAAETSRRIAAARKPDRTAKPPATPPRVRPSQPDRERISHERIQAARMNEALHALGLVLSRLDAIGRAMGLRVGAAPIVLTTPAMTGERPPEDARSGAETPAVTVPAATKPTPAHPPRPKPKRRWPNMLSDARLDEIRVAVDAAAFRRERFHKIDKIRVALAAAGSDGLTIHECAIVIGASTNQTRHKVYRLRDRNEAVQLPTRRKAASKKSWLVWTLPALADQRGVRP